MVNLTELNIYPVKSMRGIAVQSWPVVATGLAFDRRWMVVDHNGDQVTQRDVPRLCLVTPALYGPTTTPDADATASDPAATLLRLSAPAAGSVSLAVDAPGEPCSVTVWDDTATAVGGDPRVDAWLSDFLDRAVRIVRFEAVPQVPGRVWQRVAFPDSLPFLLIGQGSLDDLNQRLLAQGEPPLAMRRFRPNLVVNDHEPFAEDGWREISVGEIDFSVSRPCGRCMITTIDPDTGQVGREPLRTLATYRTVDRKVMFGQKLVHHTTGTLRVGDPLVVQSQR